MIVVSVLAVAVLVYIYGIDWDYGVADREQNCSDRRTADTYLLKSGEKQRNAAGRFVLILLILALTVFRVTYMPF